MVREMDSRKFAQRVFIILALALVLLTPIRIYAQVSGATLTGTVSDASGAVIPNAQVSVKNVATGQVRAVTTDAAGFYTAPNLLPDSYEVTVTAPGFSTEVRSGITLTVGAQQLLNITMQVGQATQTVQVTGEAPAVQLANSTIGGVVSQTAVVELPLNGRDWTSLATLQPGVISIGSIQANTASKDRANRGYGVQMTISGSRPQENNYRIDGISVNDYTNGGPGSVEGSTLGVDAVQEFSVLTSNYSAEYGRTAGGVVNAITKSGTNSSTAMRMSSCATVPWTLATTLILPISPHSAGTNLGELWQGRSGRTTLSSLVTTKDSARAKRSARQFSSLRRRSAMEFYARSHNQAFARRAELVVPPIRIQPPV